MKLKEVKTYILSKEDILEAIKGYLYDNEDEGEIQDNDINLHSKNGVGIIAIVKLETERDI